MSVFLITDGTICFKTIPSSKARFPIETAGFHFSHLMSVIRLQIISYYVSIGKGYDVDKPRKLAKSVNME